MLPPIIHGYGLRVDHDLHTILEEKRCVRRGAPTMLEIRGAAEPFASHNPLASAAHTLPRATLIELASDPRFAGRIEMRKRSLRVLLGRVLLSLGNRMVRG